MKKWIGAALLFVSVCMLFAGCGNHAQPVTVKTVVLSQVRDAVLQELGEEAPFLIETDALMNLYGIEPQWVASSASFVTMDGTFPHEVIFVEAADLDAADEIRGKLQNRLDEVLVQSKTYDAENYAAAQACTVTVDGPYVCLILSPEYQQITELYQNSLYEE